MSTNNSSQTLFRFVSLRNPELATIKFNPNFIEKPDKVRTVFDNVIYTWKTTKSSKSKIEALILSTSDIANCLGGKSFYTKEEDLKRIYGKLYDASKALAKNRKIEVNELLNITQDLSSFEQNESDFWDNLIYQVITQGDFYLKEALFQIIQAYNYIKKAIIDRSVKNAVEDDGYVKFYNSLTEEELSKYKDGLANAKVVLPAYLFVDDFPVDIPMDIPEAFTVNESAIGSGVINPNEVSRLEALLASPETFEQAAAADVAKLMPLAKKNQEYNLAALNKKRLESLKKDLLKAKKAYQKECQKSYDAAQTKYQESIRPTLDAYKQSVLEAKAALPENATDEAVDMAVSNLSLPVLPDFNFSFRGELDAGFIDSKLSLENKRSLGRLIGIIAPKDTVASKPENAISLTSSYAVLSDSDYQTFDEVLSLVDDKIAECSDFIVSNTKTETPRYLSVGGVLIPQTTTISKTSGNHSFVLTPKVNAIESGGGSPSLNNTISSDYYDYDLAMDLGNPALQVASVDFKVKDAAGKVTTDTVLNWSNDGTVIYFNNIFYEIFEGAAFQSLAQFSGEITFTNGDKASLVVNANFIAGNSYTGTVAYFGASAYTAIDQAKVYDYTLTRGTGGSSGGAGTNTSGAKDSFIPSGFGVKRLGIADYLKVEQSTHAYVEGEVANIENIMAREYREKSTRRLRKSENTSTTSSDTEREKLTDTTTATRFDMQTEIAKMQQESTDVGVNTSLRAEWGWGNFSIGANYANHRSKEESTRQSVQQVQDITARALDRVVTKVHQERIEKITEEFEENNKHGFDNRTGDKHVVGVYRWVDKLMKNQIFDYGKRLMFEFMVPEPSKLHNLAMNNVANGIFIEKPVDPRTSKDFNLSDYSKISEETVKYWMGLYNVEIEPQLKEIIFIGKTFSYTAPVVTDNRHEKAAESFELEIPEGYKTVKALAKSEDSGDFSDLGHGYSKAKVIVGNKVVDDSYRDIDEFSIKIPVSYSQMGFLCSSVNISIQCELTDEAKKQWAQKAFNTIIKAYEYAMKEYDNKLAEEGAKASNIKGANPMYYRQIEQEVLKHNCIAYMVDGSVLGTNLYKGTSLDNFEVIKTNELDQYAALVKFMEQAFEWNIMSYNFYPYYWGSKADWSELYQADNVDPLFRSFLHSGMARIIVTVKPGFEDAIQFYLSTGKIWNGGEVPVIGNPLYLSVVDELKQATGNPQGKAWLTRLPTPLTILQAESIGLKVESALPYTHENPDDFEDPSQVITHSNFHNTGAQLGLEGTKKQIKFFFENMGSQQTIGQLDSEGLFPRVYSCMGKEIYIDRDASWSAEDGIEILYKALAEKVSYIDGVSAYPIPLGKNGLEFVVDVSKIKTFDFRKPGGNVNFDYLQMETDGETFVHFQTPKGIGSAMEKISDKNGVHLTDQESDKTLSFSRFLI